MNTLSTSIKNAVIGLATVSVLATGAYVFHSNTVATEDSYAEMMISATKKYIEGNEIAIDSSMTTNMSLLNKLGYFDKKINTECIDNSSVTITNDNGTYIYVPNLQCDEEVVDVNVDEDSIAYVTNQGVVGNVLSYNETYSSTEYTTGNVEVTIDMSEPIEEISNSGWVLSNDNQTLTKVFSSNESESITVYSSDDNLPATIDVEVENIDKVAPIIKINDGVNIRELTGAENKVYYKTPVTITIEEENILSSMMNGTKLETNVIQLSNEGTYVFEVIDVANTTTSVTVVVDWTAPTINKVENGKSYNDDPLVITFSPGYGKLSGGNLIGTVDFNSSSAIRYDGNYTLVVSDDAGNSNTVSFTVDKTAPTVTLNADGVITSAEDRGTYHFNKTTEKLVVNFEDALSSTSATLNGEPISSGKEITEEGTYTLVVTDAATNSITVYFTVDKSGPVIEGVVNGGIYNKFMTVRFGTAAGTLINNGTGSSTAITSPYTVKEGDYTLIVEDDAGNSDEVSFIIDVTAPKFKNLTNNGIYGKNVGVNVEDNTAVTITDNGNSISNSDVIISHGQHTLIATDAANNRTKIEIFIDKQSPIISGVVDGEIYYGSVTPTATDDTTMTATLDNKTYTLGEEISESGEHTLIVKDSAGNSSTVKFTIVSAIPNVTFDADGTKTIAEEGTVYYFNEKTKKLVVTFDDPLSISTVTLNGEAFTGGEITEDNTYELIVSIGEDSKTINFVLDRTAPKVSGVKEGEIYKDQVTISYDDGTAYLDGEELTDNTITSKGTHTLTVKDSNGNETTVNFTIDNSNPEGTLTVDGKEISIKDINGKIYTKNAVKVTFSDDYSTPNAVLTEKNGEAKYIESGDTITGDGDYTLTINDGVGHSISVNFVIDTTDPKITLIYGPENSRTTEEVTDFEKDRFYNSVVEVQYSDSLSPVSASDSDGTVTSGTKYDKDGSYSITVKDEAGNEATISFVVDTLAPTGKITSSIEDGKFTKGTVTLTFTPDEPVTITGKQSWNENGGVYTLDATENIEYSVRFEDKAGNSTLLKYKVNNIDKDEPKVIAIIGDKEEEITDFENTKYFDKEVKFRFEDASGANATIGTEPYDVRELEDGSYTLVVKDNVIEEEKNQVTLNFVVDTKVPTVTVEYDGKTEKIENFDNTLYYNKPIKVIFDDLTNLTITDNGNAIGNGETFSSGSHTLVASDIFEHSVTFNFEVDTELLIGTFEYTPSVESEKYTKQDVTVTYTPSEEGITISESDWELRDGKYVLTTPITQNGSGTITVTDKAGNSITETYSVNHIDKDLPIVSGVEDGGKYKDVLITFSDETSRAVALLQKEGGDLRISDESLEVKESGKYTLMVVDGTYSGTGDTSYNSVTYSFTIDNEKPNLYLVGDTETQITESNSAETPVYYTSAVKFRFEDRLTSVSATLNGAAYESLTIIDENKTYLLIVEDELGNKIEHHFVVNIDKIGPQQLGDVTMTPDPSEGWTNQDVTITLEVDESAVSFNAASYGVTALNPDDNGYATKFQVTVKDKGSFTFEVKDALGNESRIKVDVDHIDKDLPTVSGITDGGKYKDGVTITFSDETSGAVALLRKEGGDLIISDESLEVKESGKYTLMVVDGTYSGTGDTSYNSVTYSFTIDNEKPNLYLVGDTETQITESNSAETPIYYTSAVKFRFEDRLTSVSATLNGAAYESLTIIDENDTYVLVIEDELGNKIEHHFIIDNEVPIVKVVGEDEPITESNTVENPVIYTNALAFEYSDRLSGIKVATLNGDAYENKATIDENDTYVLIVEDELGNRIEYHFVVNIDKIGPQQVGDVTMTPGPSEGWTNQNVTITIEVDEPSVSFNAASYGVTALNPDDNGYATKFQVTVKKKEPFVFKLKDVSGNESRIKVDVNHIDKDLPTIVGVEDGGKYKDGVTITFSDETSRAVALLQKEGGDLIISDEALEVKESGKYTLMVVDGTYSGTGDTSYNSVTYSFTIDNEKPNLYLVGDTETQITESNSAEMPVYYTSAVKFRFEDELTSASATLNGDSYKNNKSISKNDTYVLIVEDELGNKIEHHFVIDSKGPQQVGDVTMTPSPSEGWTNQNVTITIEVDEPSVSFNAASYGVTALNPDDNGYATKFQVTVKKKEPFVFKLKDALGNESRIKVDVDHIDKDLPTVSGIEDGGKYKDGVEITFSDETSRAVALLQKEGGDLRISDEALEVKESGKYTLMVVDGTYSGTEDTSYNSVTYTFTIDNEVPVVKVIGEDEPIIESNTIENPVSYSNAIAFEYSDNLSGIKVATLNGEVYENKTTINENKAYVLIVEDELGNKIEHHFVIDSKGPQQVGDVTMTPDPSEGWTNQNVTITIEVDEPSVSFNAASYGVTALNPDDNGYATKFQVTVKDKGPFVFKLKDSLGNESRIKVDVDHIDKNLPTVNGVEDGGKYKDVLITFSDETSGAVALLQKEGGDLIISDEALEVNESGKYTLMVVDGTYSGTGDTSYNSVTYSFTIDNEKPNLYLVGDTETQITESNSVETPVYYTSAVKFRFEDELTSVSATLNGAAYESLTTIDENDTYVLIVEDELGNKIEYHFVVNIDKIGPQQVGDVTMTPSSSEGWTNQDVTITIEVDEPAVSFNAASYGVTALNPDDNGYATKFQVTVKKKEPFVFKLKDSLGNESRISVDVDHIDKDLPTVSGVEDGGKYKDGVEITFSDETSRVVALLQKEGGDLIISDESLEVKESGKYTLMVVDGTYSGTGDTSYNSVTYSFTIDNEAPRVFITVGDESEREITVFDEIEYYNKSINFRLEDSIGIEEVTLTKDGEQVAYTGSIQADATTNGAYTLVVKDSLHTVTYNFVIDTIAPTAADVNVNNGIYYSHDITLEPSESIAKVILNGSEITDLNVTAEQVHRLKLVDKAGNESAIIYFGIDKTKPVVKINDSVVENGTKDLYYGPGIKIDASDLTNMKAYIITGENEEVFTLGGTYSIAGKHTLRVVDTAGNATVVEFEIDSEINVGRFEYSVPAGSYTNTGVTVSYIPGEEGITISENGWELRDGKYVLTTPITENTLEGKITVTDRAGNTITETYSVNNIDKEDPLLYITVGEGTETLVENIDETIYYYNKSVTFRFEDLLTNVATATLQKGNADATSYTGEPITESGTYILVVSDGVVDEVKNTVTYNFVIDTDMPRTDVVNGKTYNGDVTIGISDKTSTPSATIDGVALTDENKTVTTEGVHTLIITDQAGNTTEPPITFTIDKTRPTLTVIDTNGTRYTVDPTSSQDLLSFTSTQTIEVGSEFTPFKFEVDDNIGASVSIDNQVNTSVVSSNSIIHTITYTATDNAEWESKIIVTVKVVDTTSPVITLNNPEQNPQYIDLGGNYTDPGATAYDAYDGNIKVTSRGEILYNKVGTYTVTYVAVDASGNKTEATRTVIVRPVAITDTFISGNNCEEGTDCYNTTNEDNYVWYSGYLWRVIKVNSNGTLKMITESPIGAFAYHRSSSTFTGSYIEQWLNNNFYYSLEDYSTVVEPSAYCTEEISKNSTCGPVTSNVGLLTVDEYNELGGADSFLNTGDVYFTMTQASEEAVWLVLPNGSTSKKYLVYETYGIRPVITIDAVNLVSGDGTIDQPYRIQGDDSGVTGEALTNQNTGEFVKFSGFTWRIVSTSSEGTKLILDSYLKDETGNVVEIPFGTVGVYDTESGVGGYLNSTFLGRIDKSALVSTNWYYNKYSLGGNPLVTSLDETTANYTNAYVGLIRIGDLMSSNSFTNRGTQLTSWVINPYITSAWYNTWVGVMDYNNNRTERGLKPVITLNPSVEIVSGDGTHKLPYELKY